MTTARGYTKRCANCDEIIMSFHCQPYCCLQCKLEDEYKHPIKEIVLAALELDGTVRTAAKTLGVSYNWLITFNRDNKLRREIVWRYVE